MNQPQWSGNHPDYIVIKTAPNVIDVGNVAGSWLDRRKMPYLEIAVELYDCRLSPTNEFEVGEDGAVAQIWLLEKV